MWSVIGEGYCDHRSRDHSDCIMFQALWISNTVTDENIKRYMFEGILKKSDYVLYVAADLSREPVDMQGLRGQPWMEPLLTSFLCMSCSHILFSGI